MVRVRLCYGFLLILLVLQALLNIMNLRCLRQDASEQNLDVKRRKSKMALNQTMLPPGVSARSKRPAGALAAGINLTDGKFRHNGQLEILQSIVQRLKAELAVRQDASIGLAYYNSTFHSGGLNMRDPHRIPYARVRQELRLDEPTIVSGGTGPAAGCNPFCGASVKAS